MSYRLWERPKVKVGGRYFVNEVVFEIDQVELVPFSTITEKDVRAAGESSLEELRRRAAHAGPIDEDTLLYRVQFHVSRQGAD